MDSTRTTRDRGALAAFGGPTERHFGVVLDPNDSDDGDNDFSEAQREASFGGLLGETWQRGKETRVAARSAGAKQLQGRKHLLLLLHPPLPSDVTRPT